METISVRSYRESGVAATASAHSEKCPLTMGYVAPKVFAHNDVPSSTVPFVELLFDLCSDVLLDVVFLECRCGDLHTLLLHILCHINVFDDGLWARGTAVLSGRRASFSGCGRWGCVGHG